MKVILINGLILVNNHSKFKKSYIFRSTYLKNMFKVLSD